MLFFIAAIFLFNSTKAEKTEARELTGISGEWFAEIPSNEIQRATPRTEAGATVYDVTLAPGSTNTTTSDDLAKQVVTTVATPRHRRCGFLLRSQFRVRGAQRGPEPDRAGRPVVARTACS